MESSYTVTATITQTQSFAASRHQENQWARSRGHRVTPSFHISQTVLACECPTEIPDAVVVPSIHLHRNSCTFPHNIDPQTQLMPQRSSQLQLSETPLISHACSPYLYQHTNLDELRSGHLLGHNRLKYLRCLHLKQHSDHRQHLFFRWRRPRPPGILQNTCYYIFLKRHVVFQARNKLFTVITLMNLLYLN